MPSLSLRQAALRHCFSKWKESLQRVDLLEEAGCMEDAEAAEDEYRHWLIEHLSVSSKRYYRKRKKHRRSTLLPLFCKGTVEACLVLVLVDSRWAEAAQRQNTWHRSDIRVPVDHPNSCQLMSTHLPTDNWSCRRKLIKFGNPWCRLLMWQGRVANVLTFLERPWGSPELAFSRQSSEHSNVGDTWTPVH